MKGERRYFGSVSTTPILPKRELATCRRCGMRAGGEAMIKARRATVGVCRNTEACDKRRRRAPGTPAKGE